MLKYLCLVFGLFARENIGADDGTKAFAVHFNAGHALVEADIFVIAAIVKGKPLVAPVMSTIFPDIYIPPMFSFIIAFWGTRFNTFLARFCFCRQKSPFELPCSKTNGVSFYNLAI